MELTDPVLAAYQREYDEAAADWRQLETKASATTVMAGAFLAAVIAVVGKAVESPTWIDVLAASMSLIAILRGVIAAVTALRTRFTQLPPDGNTVGEILACAARRSYHDDAARRNAVIRLLRWHWYRAVDDVQNGNRNKGAALIAAQDLVLLGGALVAGFGLLHLVARVQVTGG